MTSNLRAAGAISLVLAAFGLANPVAAGALETCAPAARLSGAGSVTPYTGGIFDRHISFTASGIALRDALDNLAEVAGIRFSYAADLLPLARAVCVSHQSAPLGRVLSELLTGVRVHPVVLGSNQIVLTQRKTEVDEPPENEVSRTVSLLDHVVVTGSVSPSFERAGTTTVTVVEGKQIERQRSASLSRMLSSSVPGLWLWEQSPVSLLARYGSIRGASSFGVSYPKVYVDGIEVANSLLVTRFDPDAISRIEVIRGPQGAALYGADAISGVMNIVTRHEGAAEGEPRVKVRSRGGTISSDYTSSGVLSQDHSAAVRIGGNTRSARIGFAAAQMGAFVPDAFSEQLTASAGARYVASRAVLTSTFRLFAQNARTPSNPLEPLLSAAQPDSTDAQSIRQLTFGGTATFSQSARWTHSVTSGVDGYVLRTRALDPRYTSPLDSALRAATGSAMRGTLRGSSVGRFGNVEALAATVTFGFEHSVVRDRASLREDGVSRADETAVNVVDVRSNTGMIGQLGASFRNSLFLNSGLRVERNTSPSGIGDVALLPTVGASAVKDFGPATFKLRSAYGKAIRPIQASTWTGTPLGLRGSLLRTSLQPETQTGTELGLDAAFGKVLVLRATRFDQHASGLVQPVSVSVRTYNPNGTFQTHVVWELQNVGELVNRGWEIQGSLAKGPLTLGAAYSEVDSRVHRLSSRYSGDLRQGDRVLEIPAHTLGMNATYSTGRWYAGASAARASDWIGYDRLRLLTPAGAGTAGGALRSYWMQYDGVTRLGARAGAGLVRGVTLSIDGENLLDEQRGEPDNVTVLPGRTISAALSIAF